MTWAPARATKWAVSLALSGLLASSSGATAQREKPVQNQAFELSDRGRPDVRLDQLEFPKTVRGWWAYKKYLRKVLKREVRRATWGAGREDHIEYRFTVRTLDITEKDGVLSVHCSAVGRLPKGKRAVSQLRFSGDPKKRHELIKQVLEIVSRGVITRLAELERGRRGR